MFSIIKATIEKSSSVTLSCDQNRIVESNNSTIALNLKLTIQYRPVHPSERHRLRPNLFFIFNSKKRTTGKTVTAQQLSAVTRHDDNAASYDVEASRGVRVNPPSIELRRVRNVRIFVFDRIKTFFSRLRAGAHV